MDEFLILGLTVPLNVPFLILFVWLHGSFGDLAPWYTLKYHRWFYHLISLMYLSTIPAFFIILYIEFVFHVGNNNNCDLVSTLNSDFEGKLHKLHFMFLNPSSRASFFLLFLMHTHTYLCLCSDSSSSFTHSLASFHSPTHSCFFPRVYVCQHLYLSAV